MMSSTARVLAAFNLFLLFSSIGALDSLSECTGNVTAKDIARGHDLSQKLIVMSGGDSGIGYAIAEALATTNASIIIGARNMEKGMEAAANITQVTGNLRISVLHLDLSSFASVKNFSSSITKKIDILICDAGIYANPNGLSPITNDGFERVAQVNYISHFYLTELLKGQLRTRRRSQTNQSVTGKIIHISSRMSMFPCLQANRHRSCTIPSALYSDITNSPSGRVPIIGLQASNYGLSKFFQVFHARELARREKENWSTSEGGIQSFAVDPGFVNTSIIDFLNPLFKKIACIDQPDPCPVSPGQGAKTATYLAVTENISQFKNGEYFLNCAVSKSQPSWTLESQKNLFEYSMEWIKNTY